jgi:hypothetical protein
VARRRAAVATAAARPRDQGGVAERTPRRREARVHGSAKLLRRSLALPGRHVFGRPVVGGGSRCYAKDVSGALYLQRRLRRSPHLALRVASFVLALALVLGLARPAGTYFYCEAMGMLPWDPCVQSSATEAPANDLSGIVREQRHDCCERITVASAPRGATQATPEIAASALSAILPPCPELPSAWRTPATRLATDRWRVPPRPPGQACAQLMVFLT